MLKLVCLWVDIFHVAFPNGPGDDEGSAPPGSYERDCWEASQSALLDRILLHPVGAWIACLNAVHVIIWCKFYDLICINCAGNGQSPQNTFVQRVRGVMAC